MKKPISIALSLLLIAAILLFAACGKKPAPETTTAAPDTTTAPVSDAPSETQSETPSETRSETQSETQSAAPETTAAPDTTAAPATEATTAAPAPETTAAPDNNAAQTDFSGYDKAQILNFLAAAVNKTKSYTGNITVNHKESFTSTVTNVSPGGALVTQALNFVKDLVLKPSEEVYSFSGGTATTSEGETTQLLLPKDKAFSLPPEGVASATIANEGDKVHVVLTLSPEEVNSLAAVPAYNSSAIGYLNLDGKFKVIQIQELTIKYPGSKIDAFVRADGYVDSVTYTITLDASAKAKGMGISGTADFYGDQVEIWKINW